MIFYSKRAVWQTQSDFLRKIFQVGIRLRRRAGQASIYIVSYIQFVGDQAQPSSKLGLATAQRLHRTVALPGACLLLRSLSRRSIHRCDML